MKAAEEHLLIFEGASAGRYPQRSRPSEQRHKNRQIASALWVAGITGRGLRWLGPFFTQRPSWDLISASLRTRASDFSPLLTFGSSLFSVGKDGRQGEIWNSRTQEKKRREVGFVPPRTAEWREARLSLRGSTARQGKVSGSEAHQRI
jgi:hypothetical protein